MSKLIVYLFTKGVHFYKYNATGLKYIGGEEDFKVYECMYDNLLENIHRNLLDIPEDIYYKLEKYIEGVFGFWLFDKPCGIWETTEYEDFLDGREEKDYIMQEYVNQITGEFYADLREILKDYIVVGNI